jgi:hypothetical protein
MIATLHPLMKLQIEGIFSSLCNKLIKRELYVNNNIYSFDNINLWEDLGMTIRLRYLSRKTIIMHEAFYHYYKTGTSITSMPKISYIEEQIRCADYIEQFFREQHVYDEFLVAIQYIKLLSKNG